MNAERSEKLMINLRTPKVRNPEDQSILSSLVLEVFLSFLRPQIQMIFSRGRLDLDTVLVLSSLKQARVTESHSCSATCIVRPTLEPSDEVQQFSCLFVVIPF